MTSCAEHHPRRFGYSHRQNYKKNNKPKGEQETAQPMAARFKKQLELPQENENETAKLQNTGPVLKRVSLQWLGGKYSEFRPHRFAQNENGFAQK